MKQSSRLPIDANVMMSFDDKSPKSGRVMDFRIAAMDDSVMISQPGPDSARAESVSSTINMMTNINGSVVKDEKRKNGPPSVKISELSLADRWNSNASESMS